MICPERDLEIGQLLKELAVIKKEIRYGDVVAIAEMKGL